MRTLGIRREDKNRWERRTPLTPGHVAALIAERGHRVLVQPSPYRIFPDEEFRAAGAVVQEDLSEAGVILGVKEVPAELLLAGKPYLFFSHVIKGQVSNMPMLRRILDIRCTLIDYEPIVDRHGRRLIFFGRHAGYAGMIDALWAFGQRLLAEGIETSFAQVRPAHGYGSLDEATDFLARTVDAEIREQGIPPAIHPLVVGFTGGGNVSVGAQEILDRLPMVEIHPDDLVEFASDPNISRRAIYKVVFRREHRKDFARRLPHLSLLVNGIYWEPSHPRLVTRADLRKLWAADPPPRLRVIADISCDVGGSIEANVRVTTPGDPVYVYDPATGEAVSGVTGHGPVILAIDNLPAELPRDSSEHFSDSLFPFTGQLLRADFTAPFEHLTLPAAVQGAVVAHRGELAPRYRYLEKPLQEAGG